MKKRLWVGCFASIGVGALILDAETALIASKEAVQLCMHVAIPSLFPFFVLINLLNGAIFGSEFCWLVPLEKRMKLPAGSGSLFVVSLLGGYPTGAQLVHRAWKDGAIDRSNAQRMLAFCSNAGPAFLFGIVGPMFSCRWTAWALWVIHILSSILVGCIYHREIRQSPAVLKPLPISFSDALKRSVSVMGYVCGWIVLFRVITVFCTRWFLWSFPKEIQVMFISVLELVNGSSSLNLIKNEGLRMIVASATVSFGGICVLMQTASVTDGLEVRDYLKGKLLQTIFAISLSVIVQVFLFPIDNRVNIDLLSFLAAPVILLLIFYFAGKRKFTVAFQKKPVYNSGRNKRKG